MKVLFVFSEASASTAEAEAWLKSLDSLSARGIEPHVVLPEEGDGTLIAALKKRKAAVYIRYFTSWATDKDAAASGQAKAFRFATGRANKTTEKDIRAIIRQKGIRALYISEGTINAGLEAAVKEGIPVLWQFSQLIGDGDAPLAFIDSDAKVRAALKVASCVLASNEEIAESLLGRCPVARVRVSDFGDGEALFAAFRETMAGM